MRSRWTWTLAAALLLAGATVAGTAGSRADAARGPAPPNVVVIQTDDQTVASMSFMDRTRALLGRRGATFTRHYANWPLCCPSRATQLTGQYAHNHGVRGNSPPDGGYANFDNRDALPVWLQDRGYVTAHVGKFLNGYGTAGEEAEVPPGWSEWYTATAGTTQAVYDYTMNENGTLVDYGSSIKEFKGDVFTRMAVELIEQHAGGGQPLYLQLDYTAPHSGGPHPNPQPPSDCTRSAKPAPRHASAFDDLALPTPPSYNEADVSDKPQAIRDLPPITTDAARNIRRQYRCRTESLLHVDEGVAAIVAALRDLGVLENTYILFTSDNGYFHGEHRVRWGKVRVYEPSSRIPLLMRGPGVPAGVRVQDLTVNADLAPTVAAVTGAAPTVTFDGHSLLPAVTRPRVERGRELLIETDNYEAIHTQRYVWVEHHTGETELYDLKEDPFQLRSRHGWARYGGVRSRLAERLAALRSCEGEGCQRRPDLQPVVSFDRRPSGCAEPPVRVTFRGADRPELALAELFARGRLVDVDRRAPFALRLTRADAGQRRTLVLHPRATLKDGRRMSWQRPLTICRS